MNRDSTIRPVGIPESPGALRPVLGPFSATCVVIGAIIGIGIFFTPHDVALITGSARMAMLAWALGGLIAMAGALTFAELGGLYPRTGGQYEILRDAWTAPAGFAYVFCNATYIQAGAIAIIAWYAALNLGEVIRGELLPPSTILLMAALMIGGLTVANALGVRFGSTIQNATVVAKLLTLLAITGVALFAPSAATVPLSPAAADQLAQTVDTSPLVLLFAGLIPVFFSFGGWQHALWIGGEVRNPRRHVPLAIVLGVAIVTVVYLLVNWAYFRLLGFNGVANSPAIAADAVGVIWPHVGKRLVAGAIAVSALGVLNAQLLSGPRLICGMARAGKFFSVFARVGHRTGTPLPAILFLGGLGLALLLVAGDATRINQLLTGVVTVDSVFFFLTGLALFRLRPRSPADRTFRAPLFPLAPALFVTGEALILVGAFGNSLTNGGALTGLLWIAAALVCYAIFFRDKPAP